MDSLVHDLIYKICPIALWQQAESVGEFVGSEADLFDGFIHFSSAEQLEATAAKHFAGQHDLLLITVAAGSLGEALKWEPSRGGDLFPHLYGKLKLDAVVSVAPLLLSDDGSHTLPTDLR